MQNWILNQLMLKSSYRFIFTILDKLLVTRISMIVQRMYRNLNNSLFLLNNKWMNRYLINILSSSTNIHKVLYSKY